MNWGKSILKWKIPFEAKVFSCLSVCDVLPMPTVFVKLEDQHLLMTFLSFLWNLEDLLLKNYLDYRISKLLVLLPVNQSFKNKSKNEKDIGFLEKWEKKNVGEYGEITFPTLCWRVKDEELAKKLLKN